MREVARFSRRHFIRLSTMAAAGMLTACGAATVAPAAGAPTAAPTAETAATTAPAAVASTVEIRWADWPDMVGTKEAMEQFQQDNPGATVVFEPFGDNFDQKLMAQCVAGTAPDIMSIYGSMFFAFAEKGQLLDLRPLIETNMTEADTERLLHVALARRLHCSRDSGSGWPALEDQRRLHHLQQGRIRRDRSRLSG